MKQDADWSQARALAFELGLRVSSHFENESVALTEADCRVLARDHCALLALPSFNNSAMDGWAVRGSGPWHITGQVVAGEFPDWELGVNEGCSIATGAPVPAGTEYIVRSEHGSVEIQNSGKPLLTATQAPKRDIRHAGEECMVGETIALRGTRLNPSVIGILAATGHDMVEVRRQPRVSVLVFGDELELEGIPAPGKIRDSLGPQLPGWLNRMGAQVISITRCKDVMSEVMSTIFNLDADVIITTGGTASGPRDFLRAVISELNGEILVDGVHVRPGHPMMLALANTNSGQNIPVIGLPGNPLSAIVGLLTFGQPLLNSMLGLPAPDLDILVSQSEIHGDDGTRLVAGISKSGEFHVSEFNGSAMLRGLSVSTGFAVTTHAVKIGDPIYYLPLPNN